jgi:hypothetical protein
VNRALIYLQWTLLKRKIARFILSLRQPGTFVCVAAISAFGTALAYNCNDPAFDHLFKAGTITALGSAWLIACIVKGFLQRGMIFTPSDAEYLITAPFLPRELICFRLAPVCLTSLFSGSIFFLLARQRFQNPIWMAANFVLFQIVCVHLAMVVSLFAGRLSFPSYTRIRYLILAATIITGVVSFNAVLPLKFLPEQITMWMGFKGRDLAQPAIAVVFFSINHPLAAVFSQFIIIPVLWFQLAIFKGNLAETLGFQEQSGCEARKVKVSSKKRTKLNLPRKRSRNHWPQLHGVGVLVWRHLIKARRDRSDLFYAALVTIAYVAAVKAALDRDLVDFSGAMATGRVSTHDYTQWTSLALIGAIIWIGFLGLLLHRTLPFDFRSDGHRLDDLRLFPFSNLSVVVAELTVPVIFTLAFQMAAVTFLWFTGKFPAGMIWISLPAFAVMNIGLAATGNIFSLLFASKVGSSQAGGALGAFLLVALSLIALAPAIGTYIRISHSTPDLLALLSAIFVQCIVNGFVIFILAKVFKRCELSRELQ